MNRICEVCGRNDQERSRVEVTITPAGQDASTHLYCQECASRYLDNVDMFGMTLSLVKGIRNVTAA